jgi:hypothetical protein
MSETPSKYEAGITKDGEQQAGSVEANSRAPGGRSLQAGGEFLKALADDLAAIVSWLGRLLIAKHGPTPLRASAPAARGRVLQRLTIGLLWLASVGAGSLCGVALWVLYGFPIEPHRSVADTPGVRLEAANSRWSGRTAPLKTAEASRQDHARDPVAQVRSGADVMSPSVGSSGSSAPAQCDHGACASANRSFHADSGAGSADAATQTAAIQETSIEAAPKSDQPPVRTETQDRHLPAMPPLISGALADASAPRQCNVTFCATKYKSFKAADCTYQPYGGGPRSVCER